MNGKKIILLFPLLFVISCCNYRSLMIENRGSTLLRAEVYLDVQMIEFLMPRDETKIKYINELCKQKSFVDIVGDSMLIYSIPPYDSLLIHKAAFLKGDVLIYKKLLIIEGLDTLLIDEYSELKDFIIE